MTKSAFVFLHIVFLFPGTFLKAQVITDTLLAQSLFAESVALTDQGKYSDSKTRLWKAAAIMEANGQQESVLFDKIMHERSRVFILTNKPDSALILAKTSLSFREKKFGKNSVQVANTLLNIGSCYQSKMDLLRALEYTNMSLQIAQKLPPGNEEAVASAYNNIGNAYVQMNQLPTAILYADSAMQIRLSAEKMDTANVAISYGNMGNLYTLLGLRNKAVSYLEKSLELRLAYYGTRHPDVAISYCNLGASVYFTGDNERSLDLLEKSLEIRRELLSPDDFEMAESYGNLMLPLVALGDYDRAIENGKQAIAICKKYGLKGANIYANVYLAWGNAMVYKNEPDEAITQFKKAYDYFQLLRNQLLMAECLNNIGTAYGAKGDTRSQINYFMQALESKQKLRSVIQDLSLPYINLGVAYLGTTRTDSCFYWLQKADDELHQSGDTTNLNLVTLYNARALALTKVGRFDEALQNLEKAKTSNRYLIPGDYKNIAHLDNLLTSLTEAGGVRATKGMKSGNPDDFLKARSAYIEALDLIEAKRLEPLQPGSKSALNSRIAPLYEALIVNNLRIFGISNNASYLEECFKWTESSKSFNLALAVRKSGANQFGSELSALVQTEDSISARLLKLEQRITTTNNQSPPNESVYDSLNLQLLLCREEHVRFLEKVKSDNPAYYALKYQISSESVASASTLLQNNQALLEYFTGDSIIFLFVVRPDTMIVREVKRDFPLEDWIEGLRYGIYGYYAAEKAVQTDSLKADAKRNYLEFAPKLYQKLVAPVAQHLPEKVILVPDGPLGYIPFDALLTAAPEDANDFKSYPYLIQQHQFSYTYSATLLREMRDKKHRREPEYDFVAFAPFYNGDTTLLAGMYSYDDLMRKDLQPLAFSGPEVAAASKLMRGETVAGAAATEARFTATAGNYRILHLATHGRADNRVGDYAFLAFTEIQDSLENELLYVKDLYNLQLNADLVVLSACETGIGKLQRGEGIISLARAFAYAGAKSIVTSLWSVNDKSTSELMRFFYRELRRGKDKDEALRLARLRFLKESSVKNSHPFFWAAFVPLGDMRPVK
jgi:CHAT domain-containing protein